MNKQALLREVAASSLKKSAPVIKPGMTVRVHQRIREGDKERTQIFEGLVIAVAGGTGISGTFTVRKIVGGIGVEKVFALHGKTTPKIEVVKQAKIRRAKLYHMRELRGKAARLKETHMNDLVFDEEAAEKAAAEEAEKAEEEAAKKAEESDFAEATADKEAAAEEKVEEAPKEEAPASAEAAADKPAEEEKKEEEKAE